MSAEVEEAGAGAAMKAAVIGLGSMGLGMARSLLRAGFSVSGFDVSGEAVARFVAFGGRAAATPADAAEGAGTVIAVVVNAAQTEAVLFGDTGCAAVMAPGTVFVSSATMAPDVARRLAARLEAMGPHYLDAPHERRRRTGGGRQAHHAGLGLCRRLRGRAASSRRDDHDALRTR